MTYSSCSSPDQNEIFCNLVHKRGTDVQEFALKIQPQGIHPHEFRRTRALNYSIFNLLTLFKVAGIGEDLGIDLWNFKTSQRSGIPCVLNYLMHYLLENQSWRFSQLVSIRATFLNDRLCRPIANIRIMICYVCNIRSSLMYKRNSSRHTGSRV